jgi:hypothetical protein
MSSNEDVSKRVGYGLREVDPKTTPDMLKWLEKAAGTMMSVGQGPEASILLACYKHIERQQKEIDELIYQMGPTGDGI